MLLTGIIGYPLRATPSPFMHNKTFACLNIPGIYLPMPVQKKELANAIHGLRALGFRGVNITNPYKEDVVTLMDKLDPEAEKVRAVNTIVIKDKCLTGYNTDIFGFERSLQECDIAIQGKNVLLIGAGGVARACAWIINKLKPARFWITNRRKNRLHRITRLFDGEKVSFRKYPKLLPHADVVINATSTDLQHNTIKYLNNGATFYDVNYEYKLARYKGRTVINGRLMLVLQGARAFSLWTGQRMPVDIMKKTMRLKK